MSTMSRQYYSIEFSQEGLSDEEYAQLTEDTLNDQNRLANNIKAIAFWYNPHLPYDYDSMLEAMESMTRDQWMALYQNALRNPPHKENTRAYAGYTTPRIHTARDVFDYWINNPQFTLSEVSEHFGWRSHASAQNYITAGAPLNGMIPSFSHGREKVDATDDFVSSIIYDIYSSEELLPLVRDKNFEPQTASKVLRRRLLDARFGLNGSPSDNKFFSLIRAQSAYAKHWSSDFGGKSSIIRDVRRAVSVLRKDQIEGSLPFSNIDEPHNASIDDFRITPNEYDRFWSQRDFLGARDDHPVLKSTSVLRHAAWEEVLRVAVYGSNAITGGVDENLERIHSFAMRHEIDATGISNALVVNLSDNQEERRECSRLLSIASLMDDGEIMQPHPALLGASDLVVELEELFGDSAPYEEEAEE